MDEVKGWVPLAIKISFDSSGMHITKLDEVGFLGITVVKLEPNNCIPFIHKSALVLLSLSLVPLVEKKKRCCRGLIMKAITPLLLLLCFSSYNQEYKQT